MRINFRMIHMFCCMFAAVIFVATFSPTSHIIHLFIRVCSHGHKDCYLTISLAFARTVTRTAASPIHAHVCVSEHCLSYFCLHIFVCICAKRAMEIKRDAILQNTTQITEAKIMATTPASNDAEEVARHMDQ